MHIMADIHHLVLFFSYTIINIGCKHMFSKESHITKTGCAYPLYLCVPHAKIDNKNGCDLNKKDL